MTLTQAISSGREWAPVFQDWSSTLDVVDRTSQRRKRDSAYYYVDEPMDLIWSSWGGSTYDGGFRVVLYPLALYLYLSTGYVSTSCYEVIRTAIDQFPLRSRLAKSRHLIHLDAIEWIKGVTGLSWERIARLVGVSRQTINRWEHNEPIVDSNRRRILSVRDVLERAAARLFTSEELVAWLDTPRGADGRTPAELLEANEIGRARLLAVSAPSPRLKRAASWTNRPVAEAFRAGAERRQEAVPPDHDDELLAVFGEPGGEDGEESEASGV